jgi:glycosyltransferase involved in cell wall biosynthesis
MTNGEHQPLVTVAMPIFNGGAQLRFALLSILQQTFTDWELLLIDDGSTDGAIGAVEDIFDHRVRVLRDGSNRGLATRLNEAIGLARGRFLARMDHDDIAHPERFFLQLSKLQSDPSLDIVGAQCITISESDQILGVLPKASTHQEICARPWLGFYLAHPTWMGRIEWFRAHLYTSPGPYCCEDQELLLRTHESSRYHALPESLLAYRLRDRFSFRKALRTRVTLYGLQRQFFIGRGHYFRICLSSMAFVLRVGMDIVLAMKQVLFGVRLKRSGQSSLSQTEVSDWETIINRIKAR